MPPPARSRTGFFASLPPVPTPATSAEPTRNARSMGRGVELGRDVLHVLQRGFENVAQQPVLGVGQRLVSRPLLGRDHGEAPRFEDLAEQFLGQLGAVGVVGLLPYDLGVL